MVAPIVGPNNSTVMANFDNVGSHYSYRSGYKQNMPIDRALPYTNRRVRTVAATRTGTYKSFGGLANAASGTSPYPNSGLDTNWQDDEASTLVSLQTAFRQKLIDGISGGPNLAVAFAERQQTFNMIAEHAIRLRKAFQAVRRRRFHLAAKILGIKKPKIKQMGESVANNFLQYKYGWMPLIGDIGAGVELLQSPYGTIFGEAYVSRPIYRRYYLKGSYETHECVIEGKASVKGQLVYRVTNPSLYLANQLGFTNPTLIMWELVPFSFVVDWFLPVGDFLQSFSQLQGLAVDGNLSFYSTRLKGESVLKKWYHTGPSKGSKMVVVKQGLYLKREVGLPPYRLRFNQLSMLKAGHAASSLALLLQQLVKHS